MSYHCSAHRLPDSISLYKGLRFGGPTALSHFPPNRASAEENRIYAKVGGKITETLFDGSQADCGKVLEFSPVRKLASAWRISITERKATRKDVAFRENGDRSVVRLTHSD